ncbi:MAG: hypothetical protein ACWA5R_13075 [bacterium]
MTLFSRSLIVNFFSAVFFYLTMLNNAGAESAQTAYLTDCDSWKARLEHLQQSKQEQDKILAKLYKLDKYQQCELIKVPKINEKKSSPNFSPNLNFIAEIFRILIWVIAILFALISINWLWKNKISPKLAKQKHSRREIIEHDLTEHSNSEQLLQYSLEHWHNQQKRQAMAMLYQSCLSWLKKQDLGELEQPLTENNAHKQLAKLQVDQETRETIITIWVYFAYGHKEIGEQSFMHAWKRWQDFLKGAANEA